jgi:sarcosine oxidase subunit beta
MPDTTDVIIIGAGIHGASLAFHLTELGARVLVLERRFIAAGATGRSNGLVRMYYDLESDARLAWLSFPYFREWADRVGGHCGYVRTGFLQLMPPNQAQPLRDRVAAQQAMGIPTLLVTADDVRRLAPALNADDFEVAAFEPESGYADPAATAQGFMAAAQRKGARLIQDCEVNTIQVVGDRVIGVGSNCGRWLAPVIVNAAGPWAPQVASLVGLELPVRVLRHDVAVLRRPPALGATHPTVIDEINQMHFRPEGRTLTLVGLDDVNVLDESPDGSTDHSRPGHVDRVAERICRRIPAMDEGSLQSAYCGFEGISVDSRPILDWAGPSGFCLVCGFSGTGFKTAPAVGRAMAELIVAGRSTDVDLSPYRWGRFAGGALERMLASAAAYQVV